MLNKILFFLFFPLMVVDGGNILGLTHSHHKWNEVLAISLAKRGHNVTLLSPGNKTGELLYHLITIEDINRFIDEQKIEDVGLKLQEQIETPAEFWGRYESLCKGILHSTAFKILINYPPDYKFDLIWIDINGAECLFPIFKRFGNPPIVGVSSIGIQPYILWMMGGLTPSYVPFFKLPYTSQMEFPVKFLNAFTNLVITYAKYYKYLDNSIIWAKEIFGNDVGNFVKIERNISLILVNSNFILDYSLPVPPNIIYIGGMHIQPSNSLTKEYQDIFDKATDGIIYFSFENNLIPENTSKKILSAFLQCFSLLPEVILLKYGRELSVKLPENVFLSNTMPHNDILGNNKTKLFISFGDVMETQEAMYHGVPILGLPITLEQMNNLLRLSSRNLSKYLYIQHVNAEYVCENIEDLLKGDFRKNSQKISILLKNEMNPPLEKAIYSIESILLYGPPDYLSPKGRYITYFSRLDFDLLLFITIITSLPCLLILLCCCCTCCGKKNNQQEKIKKN